MTFVFMMQEAETGEPKTDLETWRHMKEKKLDLTEPQPSRPKYYGTAETDLADYCKVVQHFHPEVDDPIREATDENSVILAGHGLRHGRAKLLYKKVRPDRSFTRIKASLTPSDLSVIPPLRSGSTSIDVSFCHLYPVSDICSCMAMLLIFTIFCIVVRF